MIFWILAAASLFAVGWCIWRFWVGALQPETIIGGIFGSFLILLAGVFFGGVLTFGGSALLYLTVQPQVHVERNETLRAVSASSSIQGRFFLGSGYVNGVRVLNYISAEKGYSELRQANASASRIFEDESAAPYVTVYEWAKEAWWIAPGRYGAGETFDFHIPEDSILEDYTIDNGDQ